MTILLIVFLLFAAVIYAFHVVHVAKEKHIKNSKIYKEALADSRMIRSWYEHERPEGFLPMEILIDTGGWVGNDIFVRENRFGKLEIPHLTPSEFVFVVNKLKAEALRLNADLESYRDG